MKAIGLKSILPIFKGMIKINWKEIHVILGCYESNRIKILSDWTGHISVYRLPASKSQRTTL